VAAYRGRRGPDETPHLLYVRSSPYTYVAALPPSSTEPTAGRARLVRAEQVTGADGNVSTVDKSFVSTYLPLAASPLVAGTKSLGPRVVASIFRGVNSPYLQQFSDVQYLDGGGSGEPGAVVVVTPLLPKGSVADVVAGSAPFSRCWSDPMHDTEDVRVHGRHLGTALAEETVALYGRQVLEGLLYLRQRGVTLHGHLDASTVLLTGEPGRVVLSALPYVALGLEPKTSSFLRAGRVHHPSTDPDVIAFGALLYHMATGARLDSPTISLLPRSLPEAIRARLLDIFEPVSLAEPVTLGELARREPFRSVSLPKALRRPLPQPKMPSSQKRLLNKADASISSFFVPRGTGARTDTGDGGPSPGGPGVVIADGSRRRRRRRGDGTGSPVVSPSPTAVSSLQAAARSSARAPAPRSSSPSSSPSPSPAQPTATPPPVPPAAPAPPPPPPPVTSSSSSASAAPAPPRSAPSKLLSSISSFSKSKLRKATTIDKSKPRV